MMTIDTAAQVALYIFLFFVALLSLGMVGLLVALVIGLNKLNTKIDEALVAMRPLIGKSTEVLDTVQRVTMNVGERADKVLSKGEDLTERLSIKVDHTASVVEKAVTTPLINLSSVLSGVSRGFSVFTKGSGSSSNGNSHHD